MKNNSFLQGIIFLAMLILAFPALAAIEPAEAEAFAEAQGRELLDILAENNRAKKYRQLDELFLKHVDLDYIARFVVGRYWRQMDSAQQEHYRKLFKRYAVSLYKSYPLKFDGKIDFTITGSRAEENYTIVFAAISYEGNTPEENKNILAEFRMHEADGQILLTDVKLAESSMLLSYRSRFQQMIKEADEEMEWFLEDFAALVESAENINTAAAEAEL